MAKTTRLSKEHYKSLMLQLSRDDYAKPGILARLILEGFAFENGIFSADIFYNAQIIPEKTFKNFRLRLKKDGYWSFTESSASRKQYYPTKRIIQFIEQAKTNTYATIRYVESRVEPVVDDIKIIKAKMAEIEAAVAELKQALEPPIDDIKLQLARKTTIRISKLTSN